MAVQAKAKLEKAEKKAKKRKSGADGKPGKSKKAKAGSKALETALAKDAAVRAGSKPIFVQPANLASGCVLKDYQLEGVRWLVSLYENGVSGILADGTFNRRLSRACMCTVLTMDPFIAACSRDGIGEDYSMRRSYCTPTYYGCGRTIPYCRPARNASKLGS